jgi:hypothetical protein
MRILVLCEGQNEEVIINLLLDSNSLIFTRDDLIGRRIYAIRQLDNPFIKTELKHYGEMVKVFRIGDKQTDSLLIPKELKGIINKSEIYKYCTKPEFEILLIINENLEKEYEKTKSKKSPKAFSKEYIKYNGIKYDQTKEFSEMYYGGKNINKLIFNIKKYKSYKRKHNKDELYLADLLKK